MRHSMKVIQVFKDYFISVLCGTGISIPMRLWYQILRQAEHQLNMLRSSRVTPTKSAFEVMNGKHDYNSHPFCILGSAVELHIMPDKRKTWEEHTKSGFYLGCAWDHYRCHQVWIKETKASRVGQTVFFKNKYLTQPLLTPNNALIQATEDLCRILRNEPPIKGETRTAVEMLMDILKGYEGDPTKIDDHQAKMEKASIHKEESNMEEAKTNASELKNEQLDKNQDKKRHN